MTERLRAGLNGIAGEVLPVDMRDRVLAGSRRVAIRQRIVGSVAAAAIAVAGVAGAAALTRPNNEVTPPVESPTPTVTTPSPSPTATGPDPASLVDIRNATFAVPAFGDADCPAAVRRFVNGEADVDPNNVVEAIYLRQLGEPTLADVDGQPGAEIVFGISCHDYVDSNQVLALKVSEGGLLTPLGFVLQSPDHKSFELDGGSPIVVRDRVVEVTVLSPGVLDGGRSLLDLQVRGYRFANGSFSQVSGPTKFTEPPTDPTRIDVSNSTVEVVAPAGTDIVKFVNGVGEARIGQTVYSVTIVRSQFLRNPDSAVVLFRLQSGNGTTTESLVEFSFSQHRVLADYYSKIVESGKDGVTNAQTFTTTEQREVKVTVTLTGGGTEVRTYRKNVNSNGWERVS